MVFTSDKNGGKTSRDSVLIGIPTHTQWQCCGTGFARIQIIFVSFVHKTKLKSNMNVTYMKTCLMGQVFVCRRVLRFILWLIKQTKFVILLRVLELTGNPDQSCTMLRPGQDSNKFILDRAVDPLSFYADPDSAVFLNADPDPGPGPA